MQVSLSVAGFHSTSYLSFHGRSEAHNTKRTAPYSVECHTCLCTAILHADSVSLTFQGQDDPEWTKQYQMNFAHQNLLIARLLNISESPVYAATDGQVMLKVVIKTK